MTLIHLKLHQRISLMKILILKVQVVKNMKMNFTNVFAQR